MKWFEEQEEAKNTDIKMAMEWIAHNLSECSETKLKFNDDPPY